MALRPPLIDAAGAVRDARTPQPPGRKPLTLVPSPHPHGAESFAAASAWTLSPLLGREELVAQITELAVAQRERLVTLTGPGGVGKTRLAVHLLEQLRPAFRDGAVFVSLAPVRDPDLVLPAIAASIGLTETPARPIVEELHRWLRSREVLMVLDNLEQVIDCAPRIAALLAEAPGLTLLVTSRASLAISGEQRIVVPPLSVPEGGFDDPETIRMHAAVRLFEDRARRIDPRFAITPQNAGAVAAICARLDGLPLALELAAARTTILAPAALLARLGDRLPLLVTSGADRPERHRTMRQAIAWTYDLLSSESQRAFRLFATFMGGWSLELAETVEQTGLWSRWYPGGTSVLDLLHDLVDQSLVHVRMPAGPDAGESRFLMLETVRAFAQEEALALGEDDLLHGAHLEAVLAFARANAPQLDSPDRDDAHRRIEPEWENIRVAHAWALAHGRPAQALRLASAVWHSCEVSGQFSLGRAWHESAMAALPDDPLAPASMADLPLAAGEWLMARLTAAYLIEDQMDADTAEPIFRAVLDEAQKTGNHWIEIQGAIGLGLVAQARADLPGARAWFEAAAALAQEAGEARLEAIAINFVGRLAIVQMDIPAAGRIFERARALAVRIGDRRLEARYLNNLAAAALEDGDADCAEAFLQEATTLLELANDPGFHANICANFGRVYRLRGEYDRAEEQTRAAIDLVEPMEMPGMMGYLLLDLATIALDRGDGSSVRALTKEALALSRDVDEPFMLAMALLSLVRLAAREERWPVAVEAFDLGERVRGRIGMAWTQEERRTLEPIRARIASTLPRGQTIASVFDPALLAPDGTLDLAAVRDRVDTLAARLAEPVAAAPVPEDRATVRTAVQHAFGLTPREAEVLALLGQGASTAEIADALSISARTATTHISNILGKLGVSSRPAAVAVAARNGLL